MPLEHSPHPRLISPAPSGGVPGKVLAWDYPGSRAGWVQGECLLLVSLLLSLFYYYCFFQRYFIKN